MKLRTLLSLFAVLLGAAVSLADQVGSSSSHSVALRIDVDRTILPADTTEKAILKICLDGIRPQKRGARPPVNLAIVIDRSGSMAGDKIVKAREAAIEAVQQLGADDIVSVVVYDDEAEVLVPAQRRRDGRQIVRAIQGIEPGGSTALYDGVKQGAAEVRRHLEDRRFVNRVILLSDGQANRGPSSPADLGRLGSALMREGISVTTVGLGLGFNEDLMTQLAQRSDGNTYFVENSDDLPRIFAAELGDVLSIVARRVVLEVEFPAGVRPLAFVGRDGKIDGHRAELALNQIYGGQEKFALIEVEVSPSKAGVEATLASAKVTFEDAIRAREATLTASRKVKFSADREAMVKSANHQVQADYAVNVIAVAKDEAVALVDAGQREEAGRHLRERAAKLQAVGQAYSNLAVTAAAAPVAASADALAREGLDNAKRKEFRAQSAEVRSQQATPSVSR